MIATAHEHSLVWHKPAPGTERDRGGWRRRWRGTVVMAIVNVTPDSFSDGGRALQLEDAVAAARAAWAAGAAIVDVGGASTRPGADPVPVEVELARVVPVLRALKASEPQALVSVDTSSAEVAAAAVTAGADLVNDVRGLRDDALRRVVAEAGVPAVVMHMQGEPRTMQDDPRYGDVVADVEAWLLAAARAAEAAGVPSVVLDPGFGFGKTAAHNLDLVRATPRLAGHGRPLLLGASRKATIGRVAGVERPDERDAATLAVHLEAARLGCAVVRAHAVAPHVQALRVRRWLDG